MSWRISLRLSAGLMMPPTGIQARGREDGKQDRPDGETWLATLFPIHSSAHLRCRRLSTEHGGRSPFSLCNFVSIALHCSSTAPALLQHCYSTVAALDASACSPEFSVRVACYLDGVLRAPCLVPRHAAATWDRLPPRLDVASDAMQHYSVGRPCFIQSDC